MRYFVIGANGELYGPADIPTLNQWIAEGRLTPTSMIQEEFGGARFAASMLTELNFNASYPRGAAASGAEPGDQEFKIAWIMSIVGFLCCTYLTPVGLIYAIIAKRKGHSKATGAVVFSAIIVVISIAWTIFFFKIGGLPGLMKSLR